jgi:hypothetical protein
LELRVAAAVIGVIVRVDHVLHGLVRHGLQHRHNVVVVDLELVVDEHHAFVRDQRSHEAGHCDVADDVDVVAYLDDLELRRLAAELRLRARSQHDDRRTEETRYDPFVHDSLCLRGMLGLNVPAGTGGRTVYSMSSSRGQNAAPYCQGSSMGLMIAARSRVGFAVNTSSRSMIIAIGIVCAYPHLLEVARAKGTLKPGF